MAFIGIVGARKYKGSKSVENLIDMLPEDSVIVTSQCKGVCTWTIKIAHQRNLKVLVYTPDLTSIRSKFEVAKRYYQRNRDLVERCDMLHAFISKENGYIGGTRFEAEYALRLNKPVIFHREEGISELVFQYPLPFIEGKRSFSLAWQNFFNLTFS